LVVTFLVVLTGITLSAAGQGYFYGSWESQLTFDFSGGGFALVANESLSTFTLDYEVSDWLFESVADFHVEKGIEYFGLFADGYLGDIAASGSLVFYPIGEQRTKTKTRTEATHQYDWGREYFVEQLEVTNVNSTSSWYIRVSDDGSSWTTVSSTFPATTHESGVVPVNLLVRYVEVIATTGQLQSTALSPEEMTITYSKHVLRSRLRYRTPDGLTLSSTFIYSVSGTSYLRFDLRGSRKSIMGFRGSLKFTLEDPNCTFCFKEAKTRFSFPFACIEEVAAEAQFDSEGFDEFNLSIGTIDVGLSWLEFSGEVSFSTAAKVVAFTPQLLLGEGNCVTVYGSLATGATATEVTGIDFYGVLIDYQWDNVRFNSLSYFDDIHYVPVYGDTDCWESFTIAVELDACCGGWQRFEVMTAFAGNSNSVFAWAETDVILAVDLSTAISFEIVVVIEESGLTLMSIRTVWSWR